MSDLKKNYLRGKENMTFPTCKSKKDTAKHVLQCQTAETLHRRKNNTPNQWEVVVKVYRENKETNKIKKNKNEQIENKGVRMYNRES